MAMLSAIIDGVETSLDDGSLCLLVGHDGWGMMPVERYTSRGPLQDGDTDIDQQLNARVGALALKLPSTDLDTMYTLRQTLVRLFSPANTIVLKFAMPYGDRYISCRYLDSMGMAWSPRSWAAQNVAVQLRAANPLFYDLSAAALTFGNSGGGGGVIPLPVPTPIGTSVLDETVAVNYAGNWGSYPSLIRITGPITDAVIENLTLGLKLDFGGNTIADGHYIDIDLRYGVKSVLYDGITRRVDWLSTDSDLSTWRIGAAPEAPGGVNSLQVTGTGVNGNTKIQISYQNQYLGV